MKIHQFGSVGDSAAIAEKLLEIYAQHKSGKPLIYSLPQNTWDEVARRYEQVVGKVCR